MQLSMVVTVTAVSVSLFLVTGVTSADTGHDGAKTGELVTAELNEAGAVIDLHRAKQ